MGKFHKDLATTIACKVVDEEGAEKADGASDQTLIKVKERRGIFARPHRHAVGSGHKLKSLKSDHG